MKQYFISFIIVLSFFSCNEYSGKHTDNITVLNFDDANNGLLADIVMDKKQIYIKTDTKESLFGGIDKLVIKDDIIYILDYKNTRSLFTFNMDGEFLGRIGRLGRGPGEYSSWLMDFAIDNNGNVLLVDNTKQEIHKYTSDGTYLNSIPLPFMVNGLIVLENSDYLLALTYPYNKKLPQPQVIVCDSLFNKKEEYLSFFQVGDKLDISPLLKSGDDIIYHREVNDTVYIFDPRDGQLTKGYAIDFGQMSVPEKLRHDYSELGKNKEYRYMYDTPLILGKYLIGNIVDKEGKALYCFNIENNKSCLLPFIYGSLNLNLPTIPLTAINDSILVTYLDYETFMGADNTADADKKLVEHLEDGGIVLDFFTFRNNATVKY